MGKGVDKELNIYLENILKDVDPNVSLDEDQKKVVLTDSKFNMVIAGAGAGKSKTIEARVKYLVDKEGIAPDKILVLSFTNKAVDELKKDFQTLGIQCDVKTFHALGNEIIGKQVVADRDELESSIKKYLEESVLTNKALLRNMILFLGCYFKPSKEIEFTKEFDEEALNKYVEEIQNYRQFITLRGSLGPLDKLIEGRKEKHKTIQNEYLRSQQEVDIANFFYIHGIDYEYEPLYMDSQGKRQDIPNSTKPYTPDFSITIGDETIYVEHFALSDQGKNLLFTKEQIAKYKQGIKDKIQFHKEHGTKLIYTYSEYEDQICDYIDKLREELVRIGPWKNAKEFEKTQSSDEEILKKIIATEDNPYIKGLTGKIKRFIEAFRTNGYGEKKFDDWEKVDSSFNVRTKLFLSLCRGCWKEYIGKLVDGKTDFAGMINDAVKALKESNKDIQYDYIIVDEYQDISEQRFKLIQELVNYTGARLMAVGDDWQTIYSFNGSKLSLFKGFIEDFDAEELHIDKTYRNSQNLIDVAGAFIKKNPSQIPKELESEKILDKPIKIVTYDEGSSGKETKKNIANTVVEILQDILEETSKSRKKEIEILILGRYQFELNSLKDSEDFEIIIEEDKCKVKWKHHPELDIEYMTVHKSKGLGRNYVIVLNGKNDTFGFPTQIEEDPIFRNVIEVDDSIEYAEERRLFYVALTRTKNKVYLLAPRTNTSEFILELINDYGDSIEIMGEEVISTANNKDEALKCPVCGFPLWYGKENKLGLWGLYVCSNEPEVCDYMTNNYKAHKWHASQFEEADICKCDKCKDGWLIVKGIECFGNGESVAARIWKACTNYKPKNCKGEISSLVSISGDISDILNI